MNWHLLFVAIDGATIVVIGLIGARFLAALPRNPNAWLVAAICLAAISYAVASRQDYAALLPDAFTIELGGLFPLLNLLRNAGSALFMLLCWRIFRDGKRLPRPLLVLVGVQLLLEEAFEWLVLGGSGKAATLPEMAVFEVLPAVLQLVFLGVALSLLLESGDSDLIEARRRTRRAFRVIYAVQVIGSLVLEKMLATLGLLPFWAMYPVHAVLALTAFVIALVLLWNLMRSDVAQFIDPLVPEPERRPLERDTSAADVARIRAAFDKGHVYREAGLTVAGLARHLALPEYRLRRLIHGHLGYRNFNALLHDYRIGEVCAVLEDPARNGTPVLTLALSAGYQSLTPFNRAFRERKGMTPTEYRHARQQPAAERIGK